jgi:hypothetical protein
MSPGFHQFHLSMKSAREIIVAINEYYRVSIDRPQFYFRNLEAMEDQLNLLESIYEFILDDRQGFLMNSGFGNFLHENGYGNLGYSYGKIEEEDGEPIASQ